LENLHLHLPGKVDLTHLYQVRKVAEHNAAKPEMGSSCCLAGALAGTSASTSVPNESSFADGSADALISTVNNWVIAADWPFQVNPDGVQQSSGIRQTSLLVGVSNTTHSHNILKTIDKHI
jgi:hypothetical protein